MSIPAEPSGTLLTLAADAPRILVSELAPPGGLLLIIPHPDDETLGCGMALAAAAAAGRKIHIVLVTDGEGSHPCSPSVDAAALKALRADELEAALHELLQGQAARVERLGLPDGGSHVSQIPSARLQEIGKTARAIDARSIWTTWRHDPHCDHETAARLAEHLAHQLSVPLWEFAVWGRFGERAQAPQRLRRFYAKEHLAAKHRALAQHRSQFTALIADDPTAFRMPPALLQHFSDAPELFLRG